MSSTDGSGIDSIGVVVPAHDEQDVVAPCLTSVAVAAGRVAPPVHLVVVLDACRDGTETAVTDVLRGSARHAFASVRTHTVAAHRVGTARRQGVEQLLLTNDRTTTWLATTDADSVVPENWLSRQLGHHAAGADVVVGTVRIVSWAGVPAAARTEYEARYRHADGHRHVHGANLSMTADAYVAAGGFADVAHDEDVGLVDALVGAGRSVVWAGDLPVATSSRLVGRAPRGLAHRLRELSAPAVS